MQGSSAVWREGGQARGPRAPAAACGRIGRPGLHWEDAPTHPAHTGRLPPSPLLCDERVEEVAVT